MNFSPLIITFTFFLWKATNWQQIGVKLLNSEQRLPPGDQNVEVYQGKGLILQIRKR